MKRNLPDTEYRKRVINETAELVLSRGGKMTLQAKVRCGLVRICYQNGMNVAETLQIYRRNHRQIHNVKSKADVLCELCVISKINSMKLAAVVMDRDSNYFGTVPENTFIELHNILSSRHMETTRGESLVFDMSKIISVFSIPLPAHPYVRLGVSY